MKPRLNALLSSLSFVLLGSACSTQGNSPQLGTLSYEEALQAYHGSGRDEIYRCIHELANDQYQVVPPAKPIAIVIDDVLYLKLAGTLTELTQIRLDEKSASFADASTATEAGYTIVKQFNFSEYRESDDRYVDFWINTPTWKQQLRTFGNRCGI
ncbi:hypothetical protein NNO07_27580 [Pseudomonas resinovorans]|uniref:Lipoprotein n=1 Tax=Metapseudomonas resinovorans TaxID=53412 RepID=A0ABT4YD50_METRE|nr:hypothetical protein [Pseudomonas resinovorans]MDA8486837.1 hypothetical protein [Pseudomonas resinovorans]